MRHKTNSMIATSLVFAACAISVASTAKSPSPASILPDQVRLQGTEVDSILGVETLSDWRAIDSQHLTLRVNQGKQYLLTLSDPCLQLRGARRIGISMTNQEIWADFDTLSADGYECQIDTITRLGRSRS